MKVGRSAFEVKIDSKRDQAKRKNDFEEDKRFPGSKNPTPPTDEPDPSVEAAMQRLRGIDDKQEMEGLSCCVSYHSFWLYLTSVARVNAYRPKTVNAHTINNFEEDEPFSCA